MSKANSTNKKRERRFFSAEFKEQAVRLLGERRGTGVSLAQVGRELGVRPDMLRRWTHEVSAGRGAPAPEASTPSSDAAEVRRLRRELEIMRQERDFLKKASAYFARESR